MFCENAKRAVIKETITILSVHSTIKFFSEKWAEFYLLYCENAKRAVILKTRK